MSRRNERAVRAVLVVLLLLQLSIVSSGFVTSEVRDRTTRYEASSERSPGNRSQLVGPRDGVTVIGSDGWGESGARAEAELVAFAPNGSLLHYKNSYDGYLDVDPSPHGDATVTYVAHEELPVTDCYRAVACTEIVLQRANLTTGRTETLYRTVTPRVSSTRWHDVDRIDESHYVVADIYLDRVFVLNVSNDRISWVWRANQEFDRSSGGAWPRDWTHVNDVEVLPDGRFMVSLRNQDQVVFLDRRRGMLENWTLGAEDDYSTLHEQHNPDYIPESEGGPAVLVADSENNRIVEYQREDGDWVESWVWQDPRLQWPRDADRLPNGHTLITDSNGDRVFEVNRAGEVVWTASVGLPYEAERLGTGDESRGGPAATTADLVSRHGSRATGAASTNGGGRSLLGTAFTVVKNVLPGSIVNGLIYVLPSWVGFVELLAASGLLATVLVWGVVEFHWSAYRLRSPIARG